MRVTHLLGRLAQWSGSGDGRVATSVSAECVSVPICSPDLPGGAVQRGYQGAQDRAAEWPVRRLLPWILCIQSVLWLQRL